MSFGYLWKLASKSYLSLTSTCAVQTAVLCSPWNFWNYVEFSVSYIFGKLKVWVLKQPWSMGCLMGQFSSTGSLTTRQLAAARSWLQLCSTGSLTKKAAAWFVQIWILFGFYLFQNFWKFLEIFKKFRKFLKFLKILKFLKFLKFLRIWNFFQNFWIFSKFFIFFKILYLPLFFSPALPVLSSEFPSQWMFGDYQCVLHLCAL